MLFRGIALAFLTLASGLRAEETPDLASTLGRARPVAGEQSARLVERFNATAPAVQIRDHAPGSLVPVSQTLEAVSSGHVDAGDAIADFWQDRLPAAALVSFFPFGFDPLERRAWLFEGNGIELHQESSTRSEYEVKMLPCGLLPAETAGWFRTETSGAVTIVSGLSISEARNPATYREMIETGEVAFRNWRPDMLAVFEQAGQPVLSEPADRDRFFRRGREDLFAYRGANAARLQILPPHAWPVRP